MGNGRTSGYPNLGRFSHWLWGDVCDGRHTGFVTKKIHSATRRPSGTLGVPRKKPKGWHSGSPPSRNAREGGHPQLF